jgi:hypothetical protein
MRPPGPKPISNTWTLAPASLIVLANELPEIPAPITATLNDSNARDVTGELSEPDDILNVGIPNPSEFKTAQ